MTVGLGRRATEANMVAGGGGEYVGRYMSNYFSYSRITTVHCT